MYILHTPGAGDL